MACVIVVLCLLTSARTCPAHRVPPLPPHDDPTRRCWRRMTVKTRAACSRQPSGTLTPSSSWRMSSFTGQPSQWTRRCAAGQGRPAGQSRESSGQADRHGKAVGRLAHGLTGWQAGRRAEAASYTSAKTGSSYQAMVLVFTWPLPNTGSLCCCVLCCGVLCSGA